MSIVEKYKEEFGEAFEFNKAEYPLFVIQLGSIRATALVDVSKLEYDFEWKPFIVGKLPEEGFIRHEKNEFNLELIGRAVNALNPKDYSFIKGFNKEDNEENHILLLRTGGYAVMIAPAIEKNGLPLSKLTIEHLIKKAPKSVFVL